VIKSLALVALLAGVAHAQEPARDTVDAPVHKAKSPPALSYHRLFFRAGLVHMAPRTRSHELTLAGVQGPASLAVMDGPVAGSGASIDPVTVPAAIIGYTLPFARDRLSLETLVGAPIHVTFRATGTLANMSIAPDALGIPTGVPALGQDLGEAEAAPPILTLVYHPIDLGPVRPYVGTGVGFLIAYGARATNPILTSVAQPKFSIDPAVGWVLQTGLDVRVWRSVMARVDVKYIAFMKAHATVDNIEVRTPNLPIFDHVAVGSAVMDMWVNPLVVQAGLGMDF
jgi:outer membrane protein W